ncbi:triple QxxK/R motif-containing protein isoform X6 [Lates japonicus]|uniref:Triple QxxK/R motif-containing protein n=1 Tax=Lates japonicus TaxID=270547 RepID=A0AAD3REV1_LATJO|nr:triple QxxK/R motif-containing protein isoform X6 [Lates japonicus]
MGKKDASTTKLPVDQYRKQIGKQDYKKTKSALKATRLKAEAKKTSSGFRAGQMAAPRPAVPEKACELKVIPSRFEELPAPSRCGRGGPRPTCLPGSGTSGWGFVE